MSKGVPGCLRGYLEVVGEVFVTDETVVAGGFGDELRLMMRLLLSPWKRQLRSSPQSPPASPRRGPAELPNSRRAYLFSGVNESRSVELAVLVKDHQGVAVDHAAALRNKYWVSSGTTAVRVGCGKVRAGLGYF